MITYNTLKNIEEEITATYGETVSVFGQSQTLPTIEEVEAEEETITPFEFISELKAHEFDVQEHYREVIEEAEENRDELYEELEELEEQGGNYKKTLQFRDLQEERDRLNGIIQETDHLLSEDYSTIVNTFLEQQEEMNNLTEGRGDNTYNYASPMSNHINFTMNQWNDKTLVEIKFHLFGDVRANYTDTAILAFDDEHDFLELMFEHLRKMVTIVAPTGEEADLELSGLSDEMELIADTGEALGTFHDIDDAREWVKENMTEEQEEA